MSSNTLSGAGVSPANTKSQLLHIGTGTPGVGVVRTGNGTATVLEFVSGGAKITGTFQATGNVTVGGTIAVAGTASFAGALSVTGNITGLSVPVFKRLTSDVTATTTTNVALTQFDFSPVNGAVYQIEMLLIAQSAATTTGVQIVNTGGAGTLVLVDDQSQNILSAIGGTYAATNAPVAAAPFGSMLYGIFTASSTADLRFSVKSEVAASAVIIKTDSMIKITRIA